MIVSGWAVIVGLLVGLRHVIGDAFVWVVDRLSRQGELHGDGDARTAPVEPNRFRRLMLSSGESVPSATATVRPGRHNPAGVRLSGWRRFCFGNLWPRIPRAIN